MIEVKGVRKEYRRGAQQEPYLSLRDRLSGALRTGAKKERFYALEDINFEVMPGESLAIIGKNGAGKSTLLKILSRITPPTKGEIILRGRLASLLEVGTGFHSELTGRENVYLNGSILGLKRSEINRRFDEIVEFSGVEAFLDTPLKHYSSGMQLRLAFAVAAHLEPEILVIDEVLAVGDSAFQQKCIEKMTEVSQSGRTLLFVSHNMQAVRNLCSRGIHLEQGTVQYVGEIEDAIQAYLSSAHQAQNERTIRCENLARKGSSRGLRFHAITSDQWSHEPGSALRFDIELETTTDESYKNLLFGINIHDNEGTCIYHLSNIFINHPIPEHVHGQTYNFSMPTSRLKPGQYRVGFFLRANEEIQDWLEASIPLEVTEGNAYGFNNSRMISGKVQPEFEMHVGDA